MVIGSCSIDTAQLSSRLAGVHAVSDLDRLAGELNGSFHLIAFAAGDIRVQGSVSTVRQVSYATAGGVTVAADNAHVLGSLIGATIDDGALALRMAYPQLHYPLEDQSFWREVQNLPADSYLVVDHEGRAWVRRWWLPPEPTLPLAEGARVVRQALIDTVAVRTADGGFLSADLSGGMDSTSLCFLATLKTANLLTVRRVEADPGSDDSLWAVRAGARLSDAEHLVFAHDDAPMIYADADSAEQFDEPYRWARSRGRHRHLIELLVERGCQQHLIGHGGDELFGTFPSYLHTLARAHPRIATRHIRGFQALRRWSWRDTMHALADRSTFADWLAASADQLDAPAPASTTPRFGWGWPARMPTWATPVAIEAVRDLFRRAAAATPAPLANSRAQHEVVQHVRTCGRAARQIAAMASNAGTQVTAPYLDDRVIEAALAVRPHERMSPWRYKPLLAAAMHGIVPAEVLGRTTKGDFTADVYRGLKQNRAGLLELFADSVLARIGLIDADVLRRTIIGLHPTFATLIPLEQTVACEAWLRVTHSTSIPQREKLSCP
ncbi:MAG: asparagine synthase-related protein [Pseudonocardia sp.]